jgi:tetratricopeptide (TPR) repeat protein
MGLPAFQEAEVHLREALDLDPDYAQAHATFGQMRAMSYIGTTDPRDLDEALEHLERAVALDPDLGEPYLWLAYCLARREDFEAAIEAGRRAIALDRSRAEAYYFTATSYWMRGAAHYEPGDWEKAAVELERATQLNPTYQPTLMVLGDVSIRLGRLDRARIVLKQAVELERSGKSEAARFVGGETQLGLLELDQGNLDLAEKHLAASLKRLQAIQHVYAPQFHSLTLQGLARVAENCKDMATARSHLDEAIARGESHPRALGMGRVLTRIQFWQAGFVARRGHKAQARQILARADELFTKQQRFDFAGIFCCADADILLDRAMALADLGQPAEAKATRNQARRKGWLG